MFALALTAVGCAPSTLSEPSTDSFLLAGPDGSYATLHIGDSAREPLVGNVRLASADTPPADTSSIAIPKPQHIFVAVALEAALVAWDIYTVYDLVRVCAPPLYDDLKRWNGITFSSYDNCLWQVALDASGEAIAKKLVPAVKVTTLRTAIKSKLGSLVTYSQLTQVFNKSTKQGLAQLSQQMLSLVYDRVMNGMRAVITSF